MTALDEPDYIAAEAAEYLAALDAGRVDFSEAEADAVATRMEELRAERLAAEEVDPLASLDPVDLGPALAGEREVIEPTILVRDDGAGLFYRGMINGLHAKDGVGKSWGVLFAAKGELEAGNRVLWVDCEDPNEAAIVERLAALGVAPHVVLDSFQYVNPSVELTRPGAVARIVSHIDERTTLVVVDSIGEAFSLDGVNENADDEVGPWYRQVLRPLAAAGPAVVTIDHATNANDDPLRPSGSKRKRAAVTGAQYEVTAPIPFSKDHGGRLRLTCAKDRHGNYRRGYVVADIVVKVDAGRVRFEVYAPTSESTDAPLEVELAASAAFNALADAGGGPLSQRELVELMKPRLKARSDTKRAGIERAVRQGRIIEEPGPRNSRLFTTAPDRAPTAPGELPKAACDCAPSPPPIGGEVADTVGADFGDEQPTTLGARSDDPIGGHR